MFILRRLSDMQTSGQMGDVLNLAVGLTRAVTEEPCCSMSSPFKIMRSLADSVLRPMTLMLHVVT